MTVLGEDAQILRNAIGLENTKFMDSLIMIMVKYGEAFSDQDISSLTDKSLCRELFRHDYPVLLEIDREKNKKDQIYISGNYRYYAKKECSIKGKDYFYTSQLYGLGDAKSHGDNRTPLWEWVCEKVGISTEMEEGEEKLSTKEILEKIKKYIESRGFSYDFNLIENFYLSLKTKPFVLLAGTSGTGKTRLVRLFAEAIGAFDDDRYLQVAVKPDWSDSTDLFGHLNLDNEFVPGAIIDFVRKASKDEKNLPYILCLDEMNLARVEYYMSDFLSVIETRDWNGEHIKTDYLIPKACYLGNDDAIERYSKLIMPENLYIVGTVNMDETTFPFSKKVLDRANTIEFSDVNFELPDYVENNIFEMLNVDNSFLRADYLRLQKDCGEQWETVKAVNAKISAINEILQEGDAHFGYRMRDEIIFYMLYREKYDLLTEKKAFDNQIMQKVLPRIQGSSESTAKVLRGLFKECAGPYINKSGSSDSHKMESYLKEGGNANYPRSAEKIWKMMRRFEDDDFTSYWV